MTLVTLERVLPILATVLLAACAVGAWVLVILALWRRPRAGGIVPPAPLGEVSDEAMGRFFLECQALVNEGLIDVGVIARLRNALYGPRVPPLDVDALVLGQSLMREQVRRWRERGPE